MSNRVQARKRGETLDWRSMTKAERRAAAKAAAARAAAAKKRRQMMLNILAGVGVVVVIVAAFFLVRGGSGDDKTAGTPSASAGSSASASAATPAFPPLPAGADPALGKKPTVSAGTGDVTKLKTTTLVEGKGAAVQSGQTITVNYVGVSYRTGEEFDASWNSSQPFTFPLGQGKVIPGWDQGLAGVKIGSRVQLDIPSDLAYTDHPTGGQPAGPLRFVVDVLSAQ